MTSPGETLVNSVANSEIVAQQEAERQGIVGRTLQYIGRIASRTALSLSLAVSGGVVAGTASEMATSQPKTAVADTGGYPDWNKPCVAGDPMDPNSSYGKTEGTGYWCSDYQWGDSPSQQNSSRRYGYRNCTDWVAWRIPGLGVGSVPGDWRDGGNWDDAARAAGKTVDTTPEPGDIAVWDPVTPGGYGHVAVVESVNANGSVNISEYNKLQNGNYGTRTNVTDADHYIDLNGTGKGINGEAWPPGGSGGTPRPTATNTVGWRFENLEGDSGSVVPHDANTGLNPAAVEFNGQLYVFSYDAQNNNLRLTSTRPGWGSTVLDGDPNSLTRQESNTGKTPAAVVYGGELHVFYYDDSSHDLRHARSSDGLNWQFETLDGHTTGNGRHDGDVGSTPTAVVWGDSLQVFYRDTTNTNLKHAWTSPSQGWRFETLDGDPGSISGREGNVGLDPSAVVWNGVLALFYRDEGNQRLRHGYVTPTQGWDFVQLDGDPGSICQSPYLNTGNNPSAVVHDNQLHVFSYDATNQNLRHARVGIGTNGWRCEVLDGDAASAIGNNMQVGAMPTAASIGGTLQVFAYRPDHGALHHYWSGANGWQNENFDGLGGNPAGRLNHALGLEPVVAGYGGTPHVFYYDHTSSNLRHAIPN